MLIVEQALERLSRQAPQTTAQLAAQIPEIAGQEHGVESLRLLLRLYRGVEPIDGDRWLPAAQAGGAETQIVSSVQGYFTDTGKRGEMIGSLVDHVCQATGHPADRARQVILTRFRNNAGVMILNQLKEV